MDQTRDLATKLVESDPSAALRIAIITEIDTTVAQKVRTDQTGTAWIARSQDVRLAVDDRVWLVQQGSTFLVAGRLSGVPSGPYVKRKAVAQVVTSSIVPVDDDHMFAPLEIGTYRVQLFAHFSSDSVTPDLRSQWATTGTITAGGRSCIGPATNSTDIAGSIVRASAHNLTTTVAYGCYDGVTSALYEDLLIIVTDPGVLQWQWAQNVSNANAVSVSIASRLYVTPVTVL